MKKVVMIIVGLLAGIYLINPTAGVFEIIPDNIPGIGNLDEATATAILLSVFAYFGFDLKTLFGRKDSPKKKDTIDVE